MKYGKHKTENYKLNIINNRLILFIIIKIMENEGSDGLTLIFIFMFLIITYISSLFERFD